MKKIILFIFVIILIGCSNLTENFDAPRGRRTVLASNFGTIVIDSCEYITGYHRLAHKGNCVFCKERRKQEIKELIKQLNYDYKGNTNN